MPLAINSIPRLQTNANPYLNHATPLKALLLLLYSLPIANSLCFLSLFLIPPFSLSCARTPTCVRAHKDDEKCMQILSQNLPQNLPQNLAKNHPEIYPKILPEFPSNLFQALPQNLARITPLQSPQNPCNFDSIRVHESCPKSMPNP